MSVLEPHPRLDGVSPTVAKKVFDMLNKGRRYFGSSGAMMSHVLSDDAWRNEDTNTKYARESLDAERATTAFLRQWLSDKPNAVLIDSALVPGCKMAGEPDPEAGIVTDVDTDHIILFGDEVVLLDTKPWKKRKTYTVSDNGDVLMTKKEFPESNVFINQSIQKWLNYLDDDAKLTGLLYIPSENVDVIRDEAWFTANYRLVQHSRFEELLNEKYRIVSDRDKKIINSSLVAQIVVRCIKPYDEFSQVLSSLSI